MKKAILFLTVFAALTAINCTCKRESEDCHYYIAHENKSDRAVYISEYVGYPDTTAFYYAPNPALNPSSYKVNSKSTARIKWKECVEDFFKYNIASDTIMIFVFDAETLETIPWDTVCKKYMVLKRYDLTLKDLEKQNWTITYP